MPEDTFELVIVTPDEVLFEDQVRRAMVPGLYQRLAILPDHTPIFAQLNAGVVEITLSNKQKDSIDIEAGVLRFKQNKATIITGFQE